MARKLRIQFPGAIYHLMSRGDRREDIFRDDLDRESFLKTLSDTCVKTGWQIHAFCLMPNHFHLVVETPQPNLVAGMKWFLGTYTARFNRRHKLSGHVFAGRYKSLLVGGEGGYLRTVCDYVHLNPVRAKLLPNEARLRDFPWSSFGLFVVSPPERPSWLRIDRVFGECGIAEDTAAGRGDFEARLEARRAHELEEEFKPVRSGWCFGDDEYRKDLLSKVEGDAGQQHYGPEIQEASEAKADRIIAEELRRAVWSEAELQLRKKGDANKLVIARRLRAETTVTLQWIAARLHMGTKTHLSHLLYWTRRAEVEGKSADDVNRAAGESSRDRRTATVNKAAVTKPENRRVQRLAIPRASRTPSSEALASTNILTQDNSIPLTDPAVGVGGFDTSFD